MTPEELIANYPRLYHMAMGGSWPRIKALGLLSTQALVDLFDVQDPLRSSLLTQRRPDSVRITHPKHGEAVVRDQKPLIESKLRTALGGRATLAQWYQILNERVFFWLTEKRLRILANAGPYKAGPNDVITFDAARIVADYTDSIHLSHMNTGNTRPFAHPRGPDTFKAIAEYPFRDRRSRGSDAVVELTILRGLADVTRYVVRVDRWENGEPVAEIPL